LISRFPNTDRVGNIIGLNQWLETSDDFIFSDINPAKDFFTQYTDLFANAALPSIIHYTNNQGSDFSDCVLSSNSAYLST